jgi:mannose-6-phosphate isomerase-like protein (cupin superfamily)
MPIITPRDIAQFPDFPFRQYGVYFMKPGEPLPTDLHFHDCDEAWVIVSGRHRVRCGKKEHLVGVGDIVWTRMGEEHQLIEVLEPPYGVVWLENELRGLKRPGHLVRGASAGPPA